MHEFSMTSQIVSSILEKAKESRVTKILQVHLVIGKLAFLGVEQVKFSYGLLVKDTIMQNSKLVIEEKDPVVKCSKCGYRGSIKYEDDPVYHFSFPTLSCPECGEKVDLVEGKECLIKSIKVVT